MNKKQQIKPIKPEEFSTYEPIEAKNLEDAVIGALLIDTQAYDTVKEILTPECFYNEKLQLVYKTIQEIIEQKGNVDLLTVSELLKSRGLLESIGGAYYLVELTNRVASAANIEFHSRILKQKEIARKIQTHCYEVLQKVKDADVFELLDEMQNIQSEINTSIKSDITTLDKYRFEESEMGRLQTFDILKGVDIHYLLLGGITALGARPKVGKTTFGASIISDYIDNEICDCGFISLEYTASRLTGNFSAYTLEREKKIYLYEKQSSELSAVLRTITEMAKKGVKLIVLDYLSYITIKGKKGPEVAKQACQEIQQLVKSLNLHLIMLQQLKRPNTLEDELKEPDASSYADTDELLRIADNALCIHKRGIANFDGSNPEKSRELIVLERRDYNKICTELDKENLTERTVLYINKENRIITQLNSLMFDETTIF